MTSFAVIDTNVLVSSFITSRRDSPVVQIMRLIADNAVVPLCSDEILKEYYDVLFRKKFGLNPIKAGEVISSIIRNGILVNPEPSGIRLIDMDDIPFYEVVLSRRELKPHLVTGNKKHFPKDPTVVSPAEFLEIIKHSGVA